MGQKIILSDASFAGLPFIYDDPIIGAGALILHDLGHTLGAVTGVPANGGVLPNVAWKQANVLVSGAPGQAALAGSIYAPNTLAPSFPVVERTPKLGLHAIRSLTNDVNGAQLSIAGPGPVQTYIQNNLSHAYYVSIWDRITRAQASNGSPFPGTFQIGNNTSNYVALMAQGQFQPAGGKVIGSSTSNGFGASTGNRIAQLGVTDVTGTISTLTFLVPYIWGGTGGSFSGLHIGSSSIFYRNYIEDLTVSAAAGGYAGGAAITVAQRYAEVAAKDLAMYNAAFGTGGKFTGDTFTNPSGYP